MDSIITITLQNDWQAFFAEAEHAWGDRGTTCAITLVDMLSWNAADCIRLQGQWNPGEFFSVRCVDFTTAYVFCEENQGCLAALALTVCDASWRRFPESDLPAVQTPPAWQSRRRMHWNVRTVLTATRRLRI